MTQLIVRQCFFVMISMLGVSLLSYSLLFVDGSASHITYGDFISTLLFTAESNTSPNLKPLVDSYLSHLTASMELVILASSVALLVGIPLGVISAKNQRSAVDVVINNLSIVAYSMPIFWWAIILTIYIALEWQLTPVAGRLSFIYDIEPVTGFMLIDTYLSKQPYRIEAMQDALNHLILPVLALATVPTAIISRMTRQSMLTTLSQDYIKTAQSKGLSDFKIYWLHGLRNALIPLTDMLALQISTLMTGAMVTEYIFFWPGIGKWILDAMQQANYIALAVSVLLTSGMVILINAFIELLSFWLNPKTRSGERIYHA